MAGIKTIADFWTWVDKREPAECWNWLRAHNKNRSGKRTYGILYFNNIRWCAHQFAYTVSMGNIPEDMCVCHTCDNPSCCNPVHLFLGSQNDNTQDRVRKGRSFQPKGESNGHCILTEQQVLDIRAEYATGKIGYKRLGKKYGVHPVSIKDIVKRKTWAWLDPTPERKL